MKSSVAAALAACAPALWADGHSAPRTEDRSSGRSLVAEFADALRLSRSYTLECAETMPEAKYFFRPVPEVRTFGQLMVHISESLITLCEVFIEEKDTPVNPLSEAGQELVRSKADVLLGLRESFDHVERAAAPLGDSALDARVDFLNHRDFAKRRVLWFMLDHTTHHRAETVVYMRINGIRPPQYRA